MTAICPAGPPNVCKEMAAHALVAVPNDGGVPDSPPGSSPVK